MSEAGDKLFPGELLELCSASVFSRRTALTHPRSRYVKRQTVLSQREGQKLGVLERRSYSIKVFCSVSQPLT